MAKKKITGDDGKTYTVKVKKPIYKRIWFWLLVIIIAGTAFSSIGGSGDKDTSKTQTAKSSQSTKASASSQKDDGKITRADFDQIKLGDLMNQAANGDTLPALTQKFGKPDSTTTDTTNNVKTDIVTWTNVQGGFGANVIVSFTGDHAFSKNITGFKLNRKNKITLADFNALANGNAYADVIKKFGEPDGLNESLIAGEKTVIASYLTGVKGQLGANFTLTFTNDALSGKSQTDME